MLPVLVVLSGEHFRYSEGHLYDGTVLSSYGRLVVVTLNYRLGLLGKTTTGSYALLDQCFPTMINIERKTSKLTIDVPRTQTNRRLPIKHYFIKLVES